MKLYCILAMLPGLPGIANADDGTESRAPHVVWEAPPGDESEAGDGVALLAEDVAAELIAFALSTFPLDMTEVVPLAERKAEVGDSGLRPMGIERVHPRPEKRMKLERRNDGEGGEKWVWVLGDGKEWEISPDTDVRAFWDDPERYHAGFFPSCCLNDGYSAVWVTSRHNIYYSVPAAPVAAPAAAAYAPPRAALASTPVIRTANLSTPTPPELYSRPMLACSNTIHIEEVVHQTALAYSLPAAQQALFAASASAATPTTPMPEPTTATLALLALSVLLTRRRRQT